MKYREARVWAKNQLVSGWAGEAQVERDAVLDADLLLCHVSGIERGQLFARLNEEMPASVLDLFDAAVHRRAVFEPLAYIVGSKEFYGRQFVVTQDVLIPRPETELVVDAALRRLVSDSGQFTVVDIGVGSGAIILSVLCECIEHCGAALVSQGSFIGTDLSAQALSVAELNAERFGVASYLGLFQTDTLAAVPALPAGAQTLYLSNPPYVRDAETLAPEIERFEPLLALRAGEKGLDMVEKILTSVRERWTANSLMFLEIGHEQATEVESLALRAGFLKVEFFKDLAGLPRVAAIS